MEVKVLPVTVEVAVPVVSSRQQYQHDDGRLHGWSLMYYPLEVGVRVDALTSWSDRFLICFGAVQKLVRHFLDV